MKNDEVKTKDMWRSKNSRNVLVMVAAAMGKNNTMSHFRVPLYLCFKTSPCAKSSYENEFDLRENELEHMNSFLYEWFRS